MCAKPFRTKRKRASAERCLRILGATVDMGNPITSTCNRSRQGYFRIEVYERPGQLTRWSLGLEAQRESLLSSPDGRHAPRDSATPPTAAAARPAVRHPAISP